MPEGVRGLKNLKLQLGSNSNILFEKKQLRRNGKDETVRGGIARLLSASALNIQSDYKFLFTFPGKVA